MPTDALQTFIGDVRQAWGPIGSGLVHCVREALDQLATADPRQPWLSALLSERPATCELHRDGDHGFMLLAHAEQRGLYRTPHDHGRAWVCYAVQSGELEIGTFARIVDDRGVRLVRRETHILRPGHARLYLPGDIHDTRCLTQDALVFRFTERDLRHEDQVENQVTRFVECGGEWTAPTIPA